MFNRSNLYDWLSSIARDCLTFCVATPLVENRIITSLEPLTSKSQVDCDPLITCHSQEARPNWTSLYGRTKCRSRPTNRCQSNFRYHMQAPIRMKLALSLLCENPLRKTGLTTAYHEFVSRSLKLYPELSWVVF